MRRTKGPSSPCVFRKGEEEKGNKFYIYLDVTHTHTFTHRGFYTQTLLHTEAFTHRRSYTHMLLHTDAFTHRRFYTQTLLHTDAFTHRHFYTQKLYTQTLSHTDTFTHLIRVLTLVCGILPANFHIKWLLWNFDMRFDCAGSHKMCVHVLGSIWAAAFFR